MADRILTNAEVLAQPYQPWPGYLPDCPCWKCGNKPKRMSLDDARDALARYRAECEAIDNSRQMTAADLGLPHSALIDLLDRKMDDYALCAALAALELRNG